MSEKETVSFRTDKEYKEALDAVASSLERDRSFVINEAIKNFLELHSWQVRHIEEGLAQARKGKFASEKELGAEFKRWLK